MSWERVERGRHVASLRGIHPQIRCGSQRLYFNKAATELFGQAPSVMLLIDREANKAAAQPTKDEGGFRLNANTQGNQSFITCKAFLVATQLIDCWIIDARWNAEEKLLEWNLRPPAGGKDGQ